MNVQSSFILRKVSSFSKKKLLRRSSSKSNLQGSKCKHKETCSSSEDEKEDNIAKWQKQTEIQDKGTRTCKACLNSLVIKRDSTLKGIFDMTMLFVSCYNIFSNAYYSAFGIPTSMKFVISDNIIEGLFWLDMLLMFCTEYLDDETYANVNEFRSIFFHYLKGTFIVDFIACLPITIFIWAIHTESSTFNQEQIRLFRLVKFLRLPRLAALLNVQKF